MGASGDGVCARVQNGRAKGGCSGGKCGRGGGFRGGEAPLEVGIVVGFFLDVDVRFLFNILSFHVG